MRSKIPVGNNADLSKTKKTTGVVSGAVKGAQGRNAAGALAGGQVTGALAGAAQAVVSQTKARTLIILGALVTILPLALFFTIILVISSLLGSTFGAEIAGADQAAAASTGVTNSTLSIIQDAVTNTPTPWELLEATIYYETGVGSTVAQQRGVCRTSAGVTVLCPSTLALEPGTITAGSAGPSSAGAAPTPSGESGFDPTVGRNGTVPTVLSADSPDWTTTDTADWDCIRQAESDDNYAQPSGAYGILPSTWESLGLAGTPGQASKSLQNSVALEILNYEGHFYGAWNDLCTDPTPIAADNIAFIPPGVADPPSSGVAPGGSFAATSTSTSSSKSATSTAVTTAPANGGGVCPYTGTKKHPKPHYYGPYCLVQGTAGLSVAELTDLTESSVWVAKNVGTALTKSGEDQVDLTTGVTLTEGGVPAVDPTNNTAAAQHKSIVTALTALPIEFNSSAMDENIYELAVSWSVGYSPTTSSTCSTSSVPSSTSIPSPSVGVSSSDLLSAAQISVADEIISDASNDGASSTTQIAAVAAALQLSNLSISGAIYGNGVESIPSAVSAFVAANKDSTLPAAGQAANALGGTSSDYSGWIAGATQLVNAVGGAKSGCGSTVPYVAGGSSAAQAAIKAAESQIGVPYVWGGETPGVGFDCSGLVQWSFGQAGVSLPRTAQEQYDYVESYSSLTTDVAQLQPGDLVFFSDNEPGVNHVAIYLGDGNIIQAPETGEDVQYYTLAGDMSLGFLGGGAAA